MAARLKPWRVSDRFWVEVEPLLPKVERRFRYPGRKRHDDRACLEGILYVLRYAVPWAEFAAGGGMAVGADVLAALSGVAASGCVGAAACADAGAA